MKWLFPDPTGASPEEMIYALDCWEPLWKTTTEAAEEIPEARYLACVVHAVRDLFLAQVAERAQAFYTKADADLIAGAEALLAEGPEDVPGE